MISGILDSARNARNNIPTNEHDKNRDYLVLCQQNALHLNHAEIVDAHNAYVQAREDTKDPVKVALALEAN